MHVNWAQRLPLSPVAARMLTANGVSLPHKPFMPDSPSHPMMLLDGWSSPGVVLYLRCVRQCSDPDSYRSVTPHYAMAISLRVGKARYSLAQSCLRPYYSSFNDLLRLYPRRLSALAMLSAPCSFAFYTLPICASVERSTSSVLVAVCLPFSRDGAQRVHTPLRSS